MKTHKKPATQSPKTQSKPAPQHKSWWPHAVAVLTILIVNFALYTRTLDIGFFSLDDADYVVNNHRIDHLTAEKLGVLLNEPYFANYSPAQLLSYALDAALAGGTQNAFAFHLSNVLWHGIVALMVYLFAYTIRAEVLTAAAAAMLFTLHPAHVEVVAWISSRKDLVATAFGVLTMTCYLLYRRKKSRPWYVATVVSFLIASAGKQSVVLLPVVMVAWDYFVEKRRTRQMFLDKIPFVLISIFFALRTAAVQPETRIPLDAFKLSTTFFQDLWLLTGLGDYVLYRDVAEAGSALLAIALPLAAISILVLPLLLKRRGNPLFIALCYWIFIQLIPPMVLSFVTPVTDRYLFLPSVAVCIMAALLLHKLPQTFKNRRFTMAAAAAMIAIIWSAKTFAYIGEWRDPRSIWFSAKDKSESSHIREYLGTVYQESGDRIDEFISRGTPIVAASELPMASAILGDTTSIRLLAAEWQNTGSPKTQSVAYRDKLWLMAWGEFESAKVRLGSISSPNLFLHRGKLLVGQGKAEQAIPELQTALQQARRHSYERVRQEDVTLIARALGIAYWTTGNYKDAVQWYEEARRVQRASGQVWVPTLDNELNTVKGLSENRKR